MKKISSLIFISLLLGTIFSCKKTTSSKNLTLYNQPLNVIKSCIKGRWQMHYAIGGFSGHQRVDFQDTYIEFIFNIPNKDSIKWYNDTLTYANGLANYHKALHFSGPDSTYVVELPPPSSLSEWFFESFKDDTLVAVENSTEPFGYVMTKAN